MMQIMLIKFKEMPMSLESWVKKNTPQTKTTVDMLLRHLKDKIGKKKRIRFRKLRKIATSFGKKHIVPIVFSIKIFGRKRASVISRGSHTIYQQLKAKTFQKNSRKIYRKTFFEERVFSTCKKFLQKNLALKIGAKFKKKTNKFFPLLALHLIE